jgi:hypothetical protein
VRGDVGSEKYAKNLLIFNDEHGSSQFRLDGSLRPALVDYKVRLKLPPQVAITTYLPYRLISMLPIGRKLGCRNQNGWMANICDCATKFS